MAWCGRAAISNRWFSANFGPLLTGGRVRGCARPCVAFHAIRVSIRDTLLRRRFSPRPPVVTRRLHADDSAERAGFLPGLYLSLREQPVWARCRTAVLGLRRLLTGWSLVRIRPGEPLYGHLATKSGALQTTARLHYRLFQFPVETDDGGAGCGRELLLRLLDHGAGFSGRPVPAGSVWVLVLGEACFCRTGLPGNPLSVRMWEFESPRGATVFINDLPNEHRRNRVAACRSGQATL
jgi:hypothetical protein